MLRKLHFRMIRSVLFRCHKIRQLANATSASLGKHICNMQQQHSQRTTEVGRWEDPKTVKRLRHCQAKQNRNQPVTQPHGRTAEREWRVKAGKRNETAPGSNGSNSGCIINTDCSGRKKKSFIISLGGRSCIRLGYIMLCGSRSLFSVLCILLRSSAQICIRPSVARFAIHLIVCSSPRIPVFAAFWFPWSFRLGPQDSVTLSRFL